MRPGSHPRAAAARRSGFSLAEMLAVLVILGLIAALVSVNWSAIVPKTELHSAVRMLSSTLMTARSEAIARNALFKVEYDLDQQRYRMSTPFRQGGGFAATEEERVARDWNKLPSSVRFEKIQIDGVDYVQGIVFVRFDALGAASGHVVTLVQEPYKNQYTIEVQALTGLIDYHEGLFVREPARESDFN